MADQAGFNLKVIQIKGGKDPAEAVKKDPQSWLEAIAKAVPIYDYYLESVSKRFDPKTALGVRAISQELVPIWAKITDDLVREHYIQKLAALLRSDEKNIRQAVEKSRRGVPSFTNVLPKSSKDDIVSESRSRRELLEEYLIALLLHIPKDHNFVPNFPETILMSENLKQIYVLLVLYLDSISFKAKAFEINSFIKTLPPEMVEIVDRLYLTEIDDKLTQKQNWQKEVDGVVLELKKALIKASLEKLSYEIKNAAAFGKIETIDSLNKKFRDLSVKLKNL